MFSRPARRKIAFAISGNGSHSREEHVLTKILGETSGRNPDEFLQARMPRESTTSLYGLSRSFSSSVFTQSTIDGLAGLREKGVDVSEATNVGEISSTEQGRT